MTPNTEYKVKLVAIAKDEAAYLPEWIFHHLHFGFDAIDIYVNNTTDNTNELADALSELDSVRFLNGDVFFDGSFERPQVSAYSEAIKQAKNEGFSHLCFLDIDEYWVSKNFKTSIKECLQNIEADVISFEWFCRYSEYENFSMTFQSELEGQRLRWVKSIFSLNHPVIFADVHNVHIEGAKYKLANNRDFTFKGRRNGRVPPIVMKKHIQNYFVMHRMYRSQYEYVSMLAKGVVVNGQQTMTQFKHNRDGYRGDSVGVKFTVDQVLLEDYVEKFEKFKINYSLDNVILSSQKFVMERYDLVLELLERSNSSDENVINRVFRGVSLPSVVSLVRKFLHNTKSKLSDEDVKYILKAASLLQEQDSELSSKLKLIVQKS